MKILILGDVMGASGRKAVSENLSKIIKNHKIDFTIVNGENSADDGRGITKSIANEFFSYGVDVITSGNHIWDKEETPEFIKTENRLLRPANFIEGSPGNGYGVYITKDKKFKVGVINLMGNVYMRKTEDVFEVAKKIKNKIILKRMWTLLLSIFMEKLQVKKWPWDIFLMNLYSNSGNAYSCSYSRYKILENGSAYQTDIGMCGDYNSVIGMNKENSLKKFLKDLEAKNIFQQTGQELYQGLLLKQITKQV